MVAAKASVKELSEENTSGTAVLEQGTRVHVLDEKDGWSRIQYVKEDKTLQAASRHLCMGRKPGHSRYQLVLIADSLVARDRITRIRLHRASLMEQQLQTRWQITGQKTLMHQQPRECLLIVQLLAMDRLLPRLEHRLTADRQGKNAAVLQAGISFQAELPIPDRVISKIQIMRKGT